MTTAGVGLEVRSGVRRNSFPELASVSLLTEPNHQHHDSVSASYKEDFLSCGVNNCVQELRGRQDVNA